MRLMRLRLACSAIVTAVTCAPVSAATIIQTVTFNGQGATFQRFDERLGALNSVNLDVRFTGRRLGEVVPPVSAGVPSTIPVFYEVRDTVNYIFPTDLNSIRFDVPIVGRGSTTADAPGLFDIDTFGFNSFTIPPSVSVVARPGAPELSLVALRDFGFFNPASNTKFFSSEPVTIAAVPGRCRIGSEFFSDPTQCTRQSFTLTYNFTPAVTSAVPEPATWAMMLVGFGAVGYSMRKRPAYKLAQAV